MNNTHVACKNCVMDTSEFTITFDENGICRFCNDYESISKVVYKEATTKQNLDDALESATNQIKAEGKGKDYDCIIGLSGGVDSSYVSYIVKNLGLRPLAVHLDNGWDNELAVKNIENICKLQKIDLYTHVINWEEFKDLQISFLKASVANAEAPTDHAIFAILYKMALKYKVKWIIDGVNHATEYTRKNTEGAGYTYNDLKQIKGIHKQFGKIPLKTFPMLSYAKKLFIQKVLNIQQFSILNYIHYNKEQAKEKLISELGWKPYGAKHHESLFTKWHQTIYLVEKFGFDKRKLHLSDLILSKQITRDQALEELSKPPIPIREKIELEEYVIKKFGFSNEEYRLIMQDNPKSFRNYPNSQNLKMIYNSFLKKK